MGMPDSFSTVLLGVSLLALIGCGAKVTLSASLESRSRAASELVLCTSIFLLMLSRVSALTPVMSWAALLAAMALVCLMLLARLKKA
jgi:hypothetical protein